MVGTEPATVELGSEDVELVVVVGAGLVGDGGSGVETTVVEVVDVTDVIVVLLVVV